MSEMVEKVARGICVARGLDPDNGVIHGGKRYPAAWMANVAPARAAIEAMREPTREMILAGVHDIPGGAASGVPVWRAMIDAALQGAETWK